MSSWKSAAGPRPNLSDDPADHAPPSHDPPSKPDYAAVQIALMRQILGRPKPPHLPGGDDLEGGEDPEP